MKEVGRRHHHPRYRQGSFAEECVRQGLFFGVNPHYMLAVARLRSGMRNDTQGQRIGPFRLTQAEWDENRDNDDFRIHFIPGQITSPQRQIAVFALMTRRAQTQFVSSNQRNPSPKELYDQTWPDTTTATIADFQKALDDTAPLVGPAAAAVGDNPQRIPTITQADQPMIGAALVLSNWLPLNVARTRNLEEYLWNSEGVFAKGKRFFFALEGKSARCDEVVWGTTFDLVFHYDLLPESALAGIRGKRLGRLLQGNAALGIDIIPKGLLLVDGGAGRIAMFQGGRMVGEPPRFRLKAPTESADAEPAPRGVQVVFTIDGSMIYNFFLEIRFVQALGHDPCRTRVIDLDLLELAAIQVEPRTARLYIISKGDSWLIYGNIDGVELTPDLTSAISAAKLSAAYSSGILGQFTTIAGDAIWRNIDKDLQVPAADEESAIASMKSAVAAGSELYQLFSADPVFKNALDRIDKLPDGSKITILTDGAAFPWELFYPLQYVVDYPPQNYQPKKFWGHRFLIESLLITTTEEEKLPPQRRQPGTLYVSMGLNSGIDNEPPWPGRPLLPVRLQKDYVDTALKVHGAYFDQYEDIFDTLRTRYQASLIYFFCHGAASQLKFDSSKAVFKPAHVMGESYPGWPVIFVNACDAADISPLSFFPFRTKFRSKKAAGLIAPSFPIPTLFAAVFAKAFLTRYADHQPIGKILLNLRRQLLARNNPLGLWYSLQCPLDVSAPEN
jgi:hypothetical protein